MLFNLSGRWNKRASALATTALSAWLFIGAAPLFAQGAVTGTVTDSESLSPCSRGSGVRSRYVSRYALGRSGHVSP